MNTSSGKVIILWGFVGDFPAGVRSFVSCREREGESGMMLSSVHREGDDTKHTDTAADRGRGRGRDAR